MSNPSPLTIEFLLSKLILEMPLNINPPLSVPLTWKEIALYAGIILAIRCTLSMADTIIIGKKKESRMFRRKEAPKIPPHIPGDYLIGKN